MGAGDRQLPDEVLVERTLANDAGAFAQLYERYREKVYRLAYRFTGSQADALDLCQEVFVKAYESLPGFRGQARFSTWLTRIAANTCVDHSRQAQVRRAGELHEEAIAADMRLPERHAGEPPGRSIELEETRAALDAAIAQLTPGHREAFILHAVEGLTYEEIARVVGCPVGTVMSRLHYARKRLRSLLSWLG